MSFEWHKLYKWEQNIESEITDGVYEYICEYYGIGNVEELTDDQIIQIREFVDSDYISEYSPMMMGFNNLFYQLEELQYENVVG